MEHNSVRVMAILLIAMSAAGCSALRIIGTQAGVACEKTTETQAQRTNKLSRKDVRMTFSASGNELSLQLQYQPYYIELEEREAAKYTPKPSLLALVMFLPEVIALGYTIGNLADEDSIIDWDGAEDWEKAVLVGVPADFVLSLLASRVSKVKYTPWQPSKVAPGDLMWITGQPYRIDFPKYNFGKDYHTQTGDERIDLFKLALDVPDPSLFIDMQSVDVAASTTIDGKNYQEITTVSDQNVLRTLHNLALGIDMISTGKPRLKPRAEAFAQWMDSEMRAGKLSMLKIMVENTGKGELYRVTAKTASPNEEFNGRSLEFGKIDPGELKTRGLPFIADEMMPTQDVPIHITFDEYNGYVPADIDAKAHIIGKPRPKFDYAYRILDGGTPNSVGNGDGIIQRGEAVDILLTIRNSGSGPAKGVTATLNLSGQSGVEMFTDSSVEMGDITPGDSKTATFNVGVKRNASVKSLNLNLLVTETQFGDEVKLADSFGPPIDQKLAPRIVIVYLNGTITADPADVRSGADSRTPVIAQIPQNSRVNIIGQLEDWYRIKLKELSGWINAKQITTQNIPAPAALSQLSEPTFIRVFQRMPPQLTLVSPERDQIVVSAATINLLAVATDDEGVKDIELTVNGKPVEGRGFRPLKTGVSQTSIKIKETVPLSYGENQIKLIAIDTDDQRSHPTIINVTRTREMGELWVLSIGISDYQHVTKLNYADDDARAVADYFRSIGVPADHVRLLLDGDATVGAIRRAFGELIRKVKRASSVVIYFSGHGAPAPNQASLDGDGIDKYLLTWEAEPDNLYGTAFPMDEVAGVFKRLASDRVVFIADTCYSGAAGGKTILAKSMVGSRATPDYDRFLSRLVEGKGRVILTASGGSEISQELRKLGHGVFTHVLLEALRGLADKNGDGFVTVREVYDYAANEVPKYAKQNPVWKGEASGDLVIGRTK